MYCAICGDTESFLTPVIRFWSPDDGWIVGRMCQGCFSEYGKRKPHPDDFAYSRRKDIFSDEDDAISTIYG